MCKDNEELAWCAGFIDGDGSFSISLTGMGVSLAPCISATSERREPLDELVRVLGGRIDTVYHKTSSYMPGKHYGHWRVRSSDVVDMCRMLIPFLVLKREQAELMVEAWNGRGKLPDGRRGYNMGEAERSTVLANRKSYCVAMSALNKGR